MKQQGELKRHSVSKEQEHEERVLKGYVNGLRVEQVGSALRSPLL